MWEYNYNNYYDYDLAYRYALYHHGVKGQKWGIRRKQKKEYNQKMKAIQRNKLNDEQDRSLAAYQTKSVQRKVAGTIVKTAVSQAIGDAMKGDIPKTPAEFASKAAIVATKSAKTMAEKEVAAKAMSTKYTQKGEQVYTRTKASTVYDAYRIASAVYPAASGLAKTRAAKTKLEREKNEAIFKSRGGNILEARFDDVVGEANYRVLD